MYKEIIFVCVLIFVLLIWGRVIILGNWRRGWEVEIGFWLNIFKLVLVILLDWIVCNNVCLLIIVFFEVLIKIVVVFICLNVLVLNKCLVLFVNGVK